jgi:hypothetical protein
MQALVFNRGFEFHHEKFYLLSKRWIRLLVALFLLGSAEC